AHLGGGAVAVVGQSDREHGDAARPVAFVDDRLVVLGLAASTAGPRDRTLDVVVGHPLALGALDRHAEPHVRIWVGATLTHRDVDLAGELAEERAPLRVGGCLLAL